MAVSPYRDPEFLEEQRAIAEGKANANIRCRAADMCVRISCSSEHLFVQTVRRSSIVTLGRYPHGEMSGWISCVMHAW